jgi:hypothetical protein
MVRLCWAGDEGFGTGDHAGATWRRSVRHVSYRYLNMAGLLHSVAHTNVCECCSASSAAYACLPCCAVKVLENVSTFTIGLECSCTYITILAHSATHVMFFSYALQLQAARAGDTCSIPALCRRHVLYPCVIASMTTKAGFA